MIAMLVVSTAMGGGSVEPGAAEPALCVQSLSRFEAAAYHPIAGFQSPHWSLIDDQRCAVQAANAQPAMLVADFMHGQATLEVELRVETLADGDVVGIGFGFEPGDQTASDARWWLFDWRRVGQVIDFPGGPPSVFGSAGLALCEVRGVPSPEAFWGHVEDGAMSGVSELTRATHLGSTGWVPGTTHVLRLEPQSDRVRLFVDGVLEFDVLGDFKNAVNKGRLVLYDFSQASATYRVLAPRVQASATPYGTGTPGAFGVPAFDAPGLPVLGGALRLTAANASGAAADGCVLFAAAPTALDLGIGVLLVEPPFLAISVLHPLAVAGAKLEFQLPYESSFIGLKVYAQLVHTDPAAAGGYAWSRGLALVFGE